MLIFHNFKEDDFAKAFIRNVKKQFNIKAHFCKTHEEVDKYDIFPFKLKPKMVVVERTFNEKEEEVIEMVIFYGGEFAGT